MALLPKLSIADRIDAVQISSYARPHLGASLIASPCKRSLAYQYYWTHKKSVEGKLERIFRMGDAVEDLIVAALSTIGVGITGSQDRVSDSTGHAGGSIDGIATNVPGFENERLLFEGKSMNHSNFLSMVKKGVQESKPVHYGQMQMYMGRLNLQYAMYVAMDKDNCKLHIEILPFDETEYNRLLSVEQDILHMEHINELPRISNMSNWFECKFCDSKNVCHNGEKILENCRTCQHSEMHMKGQWRCALKTHEDPLTVQDQKDGCKSYSLAEKWSV